MVATARGVGGAPTTGRGKAAVSLPAPPALAPPLALVATVGGAGGAPPPGNGGEQHPDPECDSDSESDSDSECDSDSEDGSEDDYDDYDEEALRDRIEENPKNHYAAHCLGKLLMSEDTPLEGEKMLRLATKIAPDELGYHYELARALCRRNELQGGLSAIRKEIALECDDREEMGWNYHLLGEILEEKGDLKGAIAAFEKASTIDPGFLEHLDKVDMLRERLGEVDSEGNCLVANVSTDESTKDSAAIWEEILRDRPLSAADQGKLGDLISKMGKWSEQGISDLAHVLANGGNLVKFPLMNVFLNGSDIHVSKNLALHFAAQAPESWGELLFELSEYYSQLVDLADALHGKTKPERAHIKVTWGQSGRPTVDFLKRERKQLLKFADFWNRLTGEVTPEDYDAEELFPDGLVYFFNEIEVFNDASGRDYI